MSQEYADKLVDIINKSRLYSRRLQRSAIDRERYNLTFRAEVCEIAAEITKKRGHINLNTAAYNEDALAKILWEHGTWRKLPTAKKSKHAANSSATKQVAEIINTYYKFKRILRQAAGKNKGARQSFDHTMHEVVRNIKTEYNITGRILINNLSYKLWVRGEWRDLDFIEETTEALESFFSDEQWNALTKKPNSYMHTGTVIHDEIQKKTNTTNPEFIKRIIKQKAEAERKEEASRIIFDIDFSKLEAQVLADTGCTPEMLVNKPKSEDKNWGAKCYAEKGCYAATRGLHASTIWFDELTKFHKPKEFKMEIKTQTLINGSILDNMSDDAIIDHISGCEHQINTLKEVRTSSEHIKSRIKELEKNAQQLAGFLDARRKT